MKVGALYVQTIRRNVGLINSPMRKYGLVYIYAMHGDEGMFVPFGATYMLISTGNHYNTLLVEGRIGWVYCDTFSRLFRRIDGER